jgi:hypothetical protein
MSDDHSDLESMAQFAAADADRQLDERIRGHVQAGRRARMMRISLRWTVFLCAAVFSATNYVWPDGGGIATVLVLSSLLVGVICIGILFCVGGLAPERIRGHVQAGRRARMMRISLRWTVFLCAAVFYATNYVWPDGGGIATVLVLSSLLVGVICIGILFCVGGLAPEQLTATLTQQEKAAIVIYALVELLT